MHCSKTPLNIDIAALSAFLSYGTHRVSVIGWPPETLQTSRAVQVTGRF